MVDTCTFTFTFTFAFTAFIQYMTTNNTLQYITYNIQWKKGIYLPDIAVYISYKRNHLTCDYYTVSYTKKNLYVSRVYIHI